MTTNVVDLAALRLASDSRWSFNVDGIEGGVHAIVYVDDTDFDKIEVTKDYSYVFAGSSKLIGEWKSFIRDPGRILRLRPRVETNFALCIVHNASRVVEFEHGQKIVGSDHRFAGTGAFSAYQCWNSNRDPIRAVTTACTFDAYSGGTVRSLDLKTGKHNLSDGADFKSINKLMLARGHVMYTVKKEMPLAEAIKNDPLVGDLASKIARADVSAIAPVGKDEVVWTDIDVERLDNALAKCLGGK